MKITFTTDFRNFRKGDEFFLEDFSLLTGINGSGKSNLLAAIENNGSGVLIDDTPNEQYRISLYRHSDLSIISDHMNRIISIDANDTLLSTIYSEHKDYLKGNLKAEYISQDLKGFSSRLGKSLDDIERSDFVNQEMTRSNETIELFKFNFFRDTSTYLGYQERNKFNQFRNERYNENFLVLTDEEFFQKFNRPPWEIVNKALESLDSKYRFTEPRYYYRKGYVNLEFHDTELQTKVRMEYLSPGEKIILSFIALIYDSLIANIVPDIILFDEVDALLHPSFSMKIVKVIKDIFIKKLNCKVLFVTHSPSTVAVGPNKGIFLCERKNNKIEKISKDLAISKLTSDIHSLSISHENRKQIFVEAEDDSFFYEFIFKLLRQDLYPEISLNFIPVEKVKSEDSGGCEKVKSIVRTLQKSGNKSIMGIIDHDRKHKTNHPIYVLERRYTLENYIYDPVYLVAYFIREKIIKKSELTLDDSFRYTDLDRLEQPELQKIIDKFMAILGFTHDEREDIEYTNGLKIEVPKKFLLEPGHDLGDFLKEKYPRLSGKIKNHKSLKHAILHDVVDDLRGFIPYEVFTLLKRLQKNI